MINFKKHINVFVIIGSIVIILGILIEEMIYKGAFENDKYHLELVRLDSGNWSYEILVDQKVYIRQLFVPSVFGKPLLLDPRPNALERWY